MAEKPLTAVIKPVMPADWNTGSQLASKSISGSVKTSQETPYGLVDLFGFLPSHRVSGSINYDLDGSLNLISQILSVFN